MSGSRTVPSGSPEPVRNRSGQRFPRFPSRREEPGTGTDPRVAETASPTPVSRNRFQEDKE